MATVRKIGLWPSRVSGPCVEDAHLIPEGPFATRFVVDTKRAMELCWRVKKWKYHIEITQEVERWVYGGSWVSAVWTHTASSASEIALPAPSTSHILKLVPWEGFGSFVNGRWQGLLKNVPANTEADAACWSSNSYVFGTTRFPINTHVNGTNLGGEGQLDIRINRIPVFLSSDQYVFGVELFFLLPFPSFTSKSTAGAKDVPSQLNLLDQSYSVGFASGDFEQGPPNYTPPDGPLTYYSYQRTSGFVFEVEPTEYWPYDPEDGLGPIYDSTTGAQLRPFPN